MNLITPNFLSLLLTFRRFELYVFQQLGLTMNTSAMKTSGFYGIDSNREVIRVHVKVFSILILSVILSMTKFY